MTDVAAALPRPEHPRPDFMRDTFCNLNGEWEFAFDDADAGLSEGWYAPRRPLGAKITVPFCYQSRLSGVGPTDDIHPVMWYRRAFRVPAEMRGRRVLLRFGAVDHECRVFLNGRQVGEHAGGYTPFALDITPFLQEGENDLCLRVRDDPDRSQPRGKQYWKKGLMGCWYTPCSGIWQTVYLEAVGRYAVTRLHFTPDVDRRACVAEVTLDRIPEGELELELAVSIGGKAHRTVRATAQGRVTRVTVDMGGPDGVRLWSPDDPALYDVTASVICGGHAEDVVRSYFGMRKIDVREGYVFLNNRPLYQRLVLDQGYWPDGLLTPPTDDALAEDVRLTRALGYNGARKHQKIEDPRYYYWADRLGLLVWGELPSVYDYTDESARSLMTTLADFIDRDFNHPCVIAWVPLNESWGVPQIYADPRQQETGRTLYHMTKALDGTRLCSGNDGWEQPTTDICAMHDYAADGEVIARHFASRKEVETRGCDWRSAYCSTETPTGKEAFMITEYGGIAMSTVGRQGEMGGMETWGYHDKVADEDAFLARFKSVTDAIRALPYCRGYCYTQLTDVMQEINGVLTPDRKPKVDMKRFAALNRNPDDLTNQQF